MFSAASNWLSYFKKTQSTPYMKEAKKVATKFMEKPWLQGWMWTIEIDAADAPSDLDLYVKDVNFGAGSIEVDSFKIGSGNVAVPTASNAGEITMTIRDDQSLTIDRWLDSRLAKVKNQNGTINLPIEYVFTIKFFTLTDSGERVLYKSYRVFPTKKGDVTLSRENGNTIHSFPVIFQKFSTVGNKVL